MPPTWFRLSTPSSGWTVRKPGTTSPNSRRPTSRPSQIVLSSKVPSRWCGRRPVSPPPLRHQHSLQVKAEDAADGQPPAAVVLHAVHPDLVCDPLRGTVGGVHDCYEFIGVGVPACVVAARRGRLCGETGPLPGSADVIADLELAHAVDGLPRQAAVADEFAISRLDDPQAISVFGVVGLVSRDLFSSLLPGLGRRIELHDLRISPSSPAIRSRSAKVISRKRSRVVSPGGMPPTLPAANRASYGTGRTPCT